MIICHVRLFSASIVTGKLAISIKSKNLSCGFLIVERKVSAAALLLLYAVIQICLQTRPGAQKKNIMANKLNSNNFFNGRSQNRHTPPSHHHKKNV